MSDKPARVGGTEAASDTRRDADHAGMRVGRVNDYQSFLAGKSQHNTGSGFTPVWMPEFLFGFQSALVDWATRMGRTGLFADCGLGKTPMQLVWAENVRRHTNRPVLIITPLAVSFQIVEEAHKFGVDASISRDGKVADGLTVTNYERLEHFNRGDFAAVVCDESSAIKAFDGKRRAIVTDFLRTHAYRLLCTATAAPNDYIELGTSSEALGYLGHMDMLNRFFVNDMNTSATNRYRGQAAKWRFKGHAEDPFWRWVASWARAIRRPSDLGYDDDGFTLPPLNYRTHTVKARVAREDTLFDVPAVGLQEEREEARRTLPERCEEAASALADADTGIAWCHLNDESTLLAKLIDGAVEVTGSDSPDVKEEKLIAFAHGEARVLVTKPSIASWGLNFQHCHRMTFFPSHSFEQMYQAVRRCWRFGQQHPVDVDIVTTEGGAAALQNLQRKARQADRMFDSLTEHMRDAVGIRRGADYDTEVRLPAWATS